MDTGNELKKIKAVFGENAECVLEYGTSRKKHFIILKNFRPKDALKAKKNFSPKVFTTILTLDELKKTTDSMPYYLFQIALTARLLAGKNCLKKIKFDKKKLRVALERELMLFLIQYRHAFLNAGFFEKRELFNSIPQSLKKILRGILYLKGEKTSSFRQDLERIEGLLKMKANLSKKSKARIPIDEKLLAVHEFLEELFQKINGLKVK